MHWLIFLCCWLGIRKRIQSVIRKGADGHHRQHARFVAAYPQSQSQACGLGLGLDLDLQSGQGHISMCNTYRTTSMPDRVTVASNSTVIWPFEVCIISTFREFWTHMVAFWQTKFKNWASTSCRLGPVLSSSTITFELQAKVAEETDLENCNFRQFSEL